MDININQQYNIKETGGILKYQFIMTMGAYIKHEGTLGYFLWHNMHSL